MDQNARPAQRPGAASPGPIEVAGGRLVRIVLALVIIELTAATADIHFQLGGPLFTLNGVGYVALAVAYAIGAFVPAAIVQRVAWIPRLGLAGYALVTIGAYLAMGPYFALGWVAKGIESAIVGLLLAEMLIVYGSPRDVWRAIAARGPFAGHRPLRGSR